MENKQFENMMDAYKWAKKYVHEFNEHEEFDPYAALMKTETKQQQLYGVCLDYIASLGQVTEEFRINRDKIVFNK